MLRLFDVFLSPKEKRNAIISNKHDIYKLFHDLPNEFSKISKYQENVKTSLNYSLVPSLTPKIKFLSILPKSC